MTENLRIRFLNFVTMFFSTLTFIDAVDLLWRFISCLITIVSFYFASRHYMKKRRLMDIDEQIKQQQLFDIMQTNKKKHG